MNPAVQQSSQTIMMASNMHKWKQLLLMLQQPINIPFMQLLRYFNNYEPAKLLCLIINLKGCTFYERKYRTWDLNLRISFLVKLFSMYNLQQLLVLIQKILSCFRIAAVLVIPKDLMKLMTPLVLISSTLEQELKETDYYFLRPKSESRQI